MLPGPGISRSLSIRILPWAFHHANPYSPPLLPHPEIFSCVRLKSKFLSGYSRALCCLRAVRTAGKCLINARLFINIIFLSPNNPQVGFVTLTLNRESGMLRDLSRSWNGNDELDLKSNYQASNTLIVSWKHFSRTSSCHNHDGEA